MKNDWHGFEKIEDNFAMLDPIKLTLLCPGLGIDGKFQEIGIPAAIVSNYITDNGTVCEKTDTYTMLFLHSIGTTVGKSEELIRVLYQFKKDYDNNTPLSIVMPDLVAAHPERYGNQGLKDHCTEMHQYIQDHKLLDLLDAGFQELPEQVMTPASASREMFRDRRKHIPLSEAMNTVSADIIVPYPPGIPILMGGEAINEKSLPILNYLKSREKFEQDFPGYYGDMHGVEARFNEDGLRQYYIMVLDEQK